MENNFFRLLKRRFNSSRLNQFKNQFSMADDFKLSAFKLRVFVFQRIKAMRTVRENAFELILVQVFNIFLRSKLECVLFAASAGKIPVAAFLSHHRKGNAGSLKNLHHGTGNFLSPAVIRRRTAHPIQKFHRLSFLSNGHIQSLSPIQTRSRIHTPRIADVLRILKRLGQTGREFSQLKRHMTTHINNRRRQIQSRRTGLHTGAASRAAPKSFFADNAAHQLLVIGTMKALFQ